MPEQVRETECCLLSVLCSIVVLQIHTEQREGTAQLMTAKLVYVYSAHVFFFFKTLEYAILFF